MKTLHMQKKAMAFIACLIGTSQAMRLVPESFCLVFLIFYFGVKILHGWSPLQRLAHISCHSVHTKKAKGLNDFYRVIQDGFHFGLVNDAVQVCFYYFTN